MATKVELVTGRKAVTSAGTAERLVSARSAATKVRQVIFQAYGTHGIVIGDSSVDWGTTADARGTVVCDSTGEANTYQSLTLAPPTAEEIGVHGASGAPYFDLYDIWVDAKASSDAVFWTAIKV